VWLKPQARPGFSGNCLYVLEQGLKSQILPRIPKSVAQEKELFSIKRDRV
jgi:hypothetical protein